MLSFGSAYEEIKTTSTITYANGRTVTTEHIQRVTVSIEHITINDLRYGSVKTDQTDYRHIKDEKLSRLYNLVDMATGYVVGVTFKGDLREAIRLLDEYGFQHIEDGQYRAPNFEINSKKQYKQNPTGE